MSNTAFSILLPNARRQAVKATQDTSILQILEDVCEKQGLNSNEWDLKHFNRVIELGKSVRFSGLPNNATLELVQAAKPRKESAVNLVLQLDSGKRLTQQFSPQSTLWSVLEHWEKAGEAIFPSSCEGLLPVCVYMRQDIVGKEKLQEKTLKSLGLFQGSAVIRLVHRAENQEKHQANVSSILTPKPIPTPTPSVSLPTSSSLSSSSTPAADSKNLHTQPAVDNGQQNHTLNLKPSLVTEEAPKYDKSQAKDESPVNFGATNITNDDNLKAVGKDETADVPMEIETAESVNSDLSILNRELKCQQGQLNMLGEYDAVLYHADDINPRQIVSQPDEFFDVTIEDVKSIYRTLQKERKQLEDVPLQIESARMMEQESIMEKKLSAYPTTMVRIRFPDRHVLQGTFKTDNTVKLVTDFVRGYLSDPNLDFYLFKTPPKEILSQEKTLLESGLLGFAVIYIGFNDRPEKYLKETLLLSDPEEVFKLSPSPQAAASSPTHHHVIKSRKIDNASENKQTLSSEQQRSQIPSTSNQQQASDSTSQSHSSNSDRPHRTVTTDAVPKWFKGIGKK